MSKCKTQSVRGLLQGWYFITQPETNADLKIGKNKDNNKKAKIDNVKLKVPMVEKCGRLF